MILKIDYFDRLKITINKDKHQSTQTRIGILPTCCYVSVKNKFNVGN